MVKSNTIQWLTENKMYKELHQEYDGVLVLEFVRIKRLN